MKKIISLLTAIAVILTAFGVWHLEPLLSQASEIRGATLSTPKVGDKVYFGTYAQGKATDLTGLTLNEDYITSIHAENFLIEPIEWRVLQNTGGKLLLLSEKILDAGKLYNTIYKNVTWETCTLRSWLNGYNDYSVVGDFKDNAFINNAFNPKELAKILKTEVITPDNTYFIPPNPFPYTALSEEPAPGGNDTEDRIFLLSIEEASNPDFGFLDNYDKADKSRIAIHTDYTNHFPLMNIYSNYWWLRSPGAFASYVAVVGYTGLVGVFGTPVSDDNTGVRPAFNLNLQSVIFTSAASGASSKSSVAYGDGLMFASTTTDEVKLTIIDDNLTLNCSDDGTRIVKAGGTVNIDYTGAKTGANMYVSCIIEDSNGVMEYYGKMKDCASDNANGTASFTVPVAMPGGNYKIKLFSEECNDDYYTDFCSMPIEIPMTVDNSAPTVKIVTPSGTGAAISDNIVITFHEEMDDTATTGTVELTGIGALADGSWDTTKTIFTIPYSGLAYNTAYTVKISGFKDTAGNTMAIDDKNNFTTITEQEATALTVISFDSTWIKGSPFGLTIICNGDINKFIELKIGGQAIPTDNYTKESGSTRITLKPDYLETLAVGTHTIQLAYSDGTAQTTITILAATIPKTGDNNNAYLFIWIMLLSATSIVAVITSRRRMEQSKTERE